MKLSTIVSILKPGGRIQRTAWDDPDVYVIYAGSGREEDPDFELRRANKEAATWLPTMEDLKADDWELCR